jgi:competence protein ComEA
MAVPLSTDERRALAIIAALLVLAAGARWLERPRPVLEGAAALDLAALEQASRDARPAPRGQTVTDGERIDPNTASVTELTRLPGVGPALAARIVEERDRAPFRSAADLRRVAGIGAALSARLATSVSLPAGHAEAGAGGAPGRPDDGPPRNGHTAAAAALPAGHTAAAAPQPAGPIRLNRATAAELQRLTGVGPVLAARLAARRDSLGGFADWDAVDAVPGVGPALLARLKQQAVLQQRP